MLIAPLPEMRTASLAGAMLQKPRRGTILRLTRSASGIGEIRTSPDRNSPDRGGLGRNSS
jgi:hypothetical protein